MPLPEGVCKTGTASDESVNVKPGNSDSAAARSYVFFSFQCKGSTFGMPLAVIQDGLFACHLLFLRLDHFLDHIAAYGTVLSRGQIAVVSVR